MIPPMHTRRSERGGLFCFQLPSPRSAGSFPVRSFGPSANREASVEFFMLTQTKIPFSGDKQWKWVTICSFRLDLTDSSWVRKRYYAVITEGSGRFLVTLAMKTSPRAFNEAQAVLSPARSLLRAIAPTSLSSFYHRLMMAQP